MNDLPQLLEHRVGGQGKTAIVFIHGFSGDVKKTWGKFPALLTKVRALDGWDIFSLGYSTSLAPNILNIWSGDPAIDTLGTYLRTRAGLTPLKDYQALALIAHSQGGLVAQHALVDDPGFSQRVSHVLLFGTPSAGLRKAGPFRLFKLQVRDMVAGGPFIQDLRARWDNQFSKTRPFRFWVAAGDRDMFVPPESSILPFAEKDRLVVLGNHLEIVKPENGKSLSVQVAIDVIVGNAAPGGPWNAARVAVESRDFQKAIDALMPHAAELDPGHLVELALALESTGRQADAIDVLQQHSSKDTDVRGVLAGRLKRRWLAEGREADAAAALSGYQSAYETSVKAKNANQAFYHGINVAFMDLAYKKDSPAARGVANQVLKHCANAQRDYWCVATEAEAHLYLGEISKALAAYREAVAPRLKARPRELESTYAQASGVLNLIEQTSLQPQLDTLFRPATA